MTVTDEAFIHLVIRNYEDRWTMMAERTQYHQPLVRKCLLHVYVHRHINTHHTANLTSCQPKTTAGYTDEDGKSGCHCLTQCTPIKHRPSHPMKPARCHTMGGQTKVFWNSIGSVRPSRKSALLSPTMIRSTRHGQRNFICNAPPNASAVRSLLSTTN
jgi:hypothetical protein